MRPKNQTNRPVRLKTHCQCNRAGRSVIAQKKLPAPRIQHGERSAFACVQRQFIRQFQQFGG